MYKFEKELFFLYLSILMIQDLGNISGCRSHFDLLYIGWRKIWNSHNRLRWMTKILFCSNSWNVAEWQRKILIFWLMKESKERELHLIKFQRNKIIIAWVDLKKSWTSGKCKVNKKNMWFLLKKHINCRVKWSICDIIKLIKIILSGLKSVSIGSSQSLADNTYFIHSTSNFSLLYLLNSFLINNSLTFFLFSLTSLLILYPRKFQDIGWIDFNVTICNRIVITGRKFIQTPQCFERKNIFNCYPILCSIYAKFLLKLQWVLYH